ncbi:hypothetical protein PGT21_027239 [Puccinia graminis f. sp. tritici]|uniref:Uncharacterized protein n=1 Tax=Puccinia graminis f. sp. tritici TaxID=56615 RepID=A0A5B0PGL5_PUCGR|nr:hypothetical protein PGTUg99_008567 [Puccinia graminis f. sp. tritici]KAA1099982.1 hypothetical protein PGT21_027239 [Puccinia graminis f. sp. tritici]
MGYYRVGALANSVISVQQRVKVTEVGWYSISLSQNMSYHPGKFWSVSISLSFEQSNHIHTPEYHKMLFLGSNSLLLPTPLEPSVAQPIAVNSIIQRNLYRYAKVELGIYLLLDSEPTESNGNQSSLSSSGHQSSSSTEEYWNDCSETSISFNEFIPAHLYTPRRLPLTQLIKNWWRYR